MRAFQDRHATPSAEEGSGALRWEEFGVDAGKVAGWQAIGFGPFAAALAHGDGYTPIGAEPYRHQLHKTAQLWERAGLDTVEGLRWHRAGFGAKEAARWMSGGVDLETARARRATFEHRSAGFRKPRPTSENPDDKDSEE